MSFYISLTGLNAASTQLSVTSNNIANVGTTAFKRSRADFGDIFATSPLQKASTVIGQGVALKSVSQEFSQGNIQFSANSLDMALTGDGFFMVQSVDGAQTIFTRNGGFQLNADNAVVNSAGQKLLVAEVDPLGGAKFEGVEDMKSLTIRRETNGSAKPTDQIDLSLNLPQGVDEINPIEKPFDPSIPGTYSFNTSMNVYDDSNNKFMAEIYYVKTQAPTESDPTGKWQTYTYVKGERLREQLIEATDEKGLPLYVNKFGELMTEPDFTKIGGFPAPASRLYSLDSINNNKSESKPAILTGDSSALTFDDEGLFSPAPNISDSLSFKISVDSSDPVAISIVLEEDGYTGVELAKEIENSINSTFLEESSDNQRFGIKVKFVQDPSGELNKGGQFVIYSGSTGDESKLELEVDEDDPAATLFGLTTTDKVIAGSGMVSLPAVMTGASIPGLGERFILNASNNKFVVSVDGVVGQIELDEGEYNKTSFSTEFSDAINGLVSSSGRVVGGVKVEFVDDGDLTSLRFTTGTQGAGAFIKVSGDKSWGLADAPSAFGETSKWVNPDLVNEKSFVNVAGEETSSSEGALDLQEENVWAKVYLDKGELTFSSDGKLLSPKGSIEYSGFNDGFKINYTGTTNFNSPLSILNQMQNGRPEGDLIGVTVGNDGLVTANYSNGVQSKLGKIILANFTAPTGLRQLGDSSFVATAEAGRVSYGEPGEAGFASVRAGATERSNVDLTQELIELITAQRNFQANAKAIETANTMTQAIVNIRS